MDDHSVQRIRHASFSRAVSGYDRTEVDRFLAELADWLEERTDDDAVSEAVRAELERVGEQTAEILTSAHEAAEAMQEEASRKLRQALVEANLKSETLRAESEEYAERTRDEADAYARKVRGDAEARAARLRDESESASSDARVAAEREADRIVEEARRRKGEIERVIADLEERRDAVLSELERLASGLAGTATQHRAAPGDRRAPAADDNAVAPRETAAQPE